MSSSSGLVISGTGSRATSYSVGLQYFDSATARISRGICPTIVCSEIVVYLALEKSTSPKFPEIIETYVACFGVDTPSIHGTEVELYRFGDNFAQRRFQI